MNGNSRKIALVTGGSRGLGRDMALALATKKIDSVITFVSNKEAADQTVAAVQKHGQTCVALKLDVGQVATFDSFISELTGALSKTWGSKRFDMLINNAGIGVHAPISETDEAAFDRLYQIHFKGVYFLTQKCLPMINDGGRIVNISSGLARFSFPGYSAYACMKGAIETFTRYLARELGPRGITANAVAPGAIDTDFNKARFEQMPQVVELIASQTALGRIGHADDIGSVVASLCTNDFKWVTGQRIEASGGMFT